MVNKAQGLRPWFISSWSVDFFHSVTTAVAWCLCDKTGRTVDPTSSIGQPVKLALNTNEKYIPGLARALPWMSELLRHSEHSIDVQTGFSRIQTRSRPDDDDTY